MAAWAPNHLKPMKAANHCNCNQPLKAAAHGLLLGCVLPLLAYNVSRRNWRNIFIYAALIGFEIHSIAGHVSHELEA